MKKNVRCKLKMFVFLSIVIALFIGGIFGYVIFNKNSKADGNTEDDRMTKIYDAVLKRRSSIMSKERYLDKKTNREKQLEDRKEEENRVIIQLKGAAAIDKVKKFLGR